MKKIYKREKFSVRNGFTLTEVLVALFVFSGMLVAVSGVFGGFVKNYRAVKEIQKNLENAQFAMNYLAKTLRTSTMLAPGSLPATVGTAIASSSDIVTYDNSQDKCFLFEFAGNNLTKRVKDGPFLSPYSECMAGGGYSDAEDMIYEVGTEITTAGRFSYPIRTNNDATSDWNIGMVTISMDVGDNLLDKKDLVHIETTVSLRDYIELN